MPSLFDSRFETEVVDRLERLTPEHHPQWGVMSVGEMLCHLNDYFDVALGTTSCRPILPRLAQTIVRPILVNWPFRYPRNVRTFPELLATDPEILQTDRATLVRRVREFVSRRGQDTWPENPLVGRVTGRQWAKLAYKHLDHHLTQFGV